MLALLNDVPILGNAYFRIVLGIALIVLAVTLLHNNIILIAIGALILIMGIVRATQRRTTQAAEGQR